MFRSKFLIGFAFCLACETQPSPPAPPPTHAPLERSVERPVVADGTPLQRLLTHGRCYASKSHVLCANDHQMGHWQSPEYILVGQHGVLQMTELERLETKGDVRGMRFRDDQKFESERGTGESLLETIPAPAYVNDGEARFLKCGLETMRFEAMTSAQTRSWLTNAEVRVSATRVTISAMKTENGTFVVEATREGGGGEKSTALYIGPIDSGAKVVPVDTNVVLDQGFREFLLPEGGTLHYPLNARKIAKAAPAKTLPDGSSVAAGQALREPFQWATYRARSGEEPQRLYFADDAEEARLEERFAPALEAAASPACSVVFGP